MRRLPRPGATLLRALRRPRLRPGLGPRVQGRHHLHDLPRHRRHRRSQRQRGLSPGGPAALPLRRQRQPSVEGAEPPGNPGQAGVAQAEPAETPAQEPGVLLHLPQGAPAPGPESLPLAARPEPLRQLPVERGLGPPGGQLLLPAACQAELWGLPHAAPGIPGPGRAAHAGREGAGGSRSPLPRRQHRRAGDARPPGGQRRSAWGCSPRPPGWTSSPSRRTAPSTAPCTPPCARPPPAWSPDAAISWNWWCAPPAWATP